MLFARLTEAVRWRRWRSRRLRFLRATFRNGEELVRSYLDRTPCAAAILPDGTTIRHPEGRTGLAGMLLEIWFDEVYTGRFYTPRAGDTVIDGGANVGAFSLLVARTEPGCTVHAFEPFPENYELLCANLAAVGGSVRTHRLGLSGASAVGVMTDGGRRAQDHQLTVAAGSGDDPAAVRTVDFNGLLALAASDIALFKCDIEGSEYDLFAAATQDQLARVRRFAVEYHDVHRPGTLALLQQRLSPTHALDVRPDPEGGYGMLYATRK